MLKWVFYFLLLGLLLASCEAAGVGGVAAAGVGIVAPPQLPFPRVYDGKRKPKPQAFGDCDQKEEALLKCRSNVNTVAENSYYYIFNLPEAHHLTRQLYKVGVTGNSNFFGDRYTGERGRLRKICAGELPDGGDDDLLEKAVDSCVRSRMRFTFAIGCKQTNECMDHYWKCGIKRNNEDPTRVIEIHHSPISDARRNELLPGFFGSGKSEFYYVTDRNGQVLPLDRSDEILYHTLGRFTRPGIEEDRRLDCHVSLTPPPIQYFGPIGHDGFRVIDAYRPSSITAEAAEARRSYEASVKQRQQQQQQPQPQQPQIPQPQLPPQQPPQPQLPQPQLPQPQPPQPQLPPQRPASMDVSFVVKSNTLEMLHKRSKYLRNNDIKTIAPSSRLPSLSPRSSLSSSRPDSPTLHPPSSLLSIRPPTPTRAPAENHPPLSHAQVKQFTNRLQGLLSKIKSTSANRGSSRMATASRTPTPSRSSSTSPSPFSRNVPVKTSQLPKGVLHPSLDTN